MGQQHTSPATNRLTSPLISSAKTPKSTAWRQPMAFARDAKVHGGVEVMVRCEAFELGAGTGRLGLAMRAAEGICWCIFPTKAHAARAAVSARVSFKAFLCVRRDTALLDPYIASYPTMRVAGILIVWVTQRRRSGQPAEWPAGALSAVPTSESETCWRGRVVFGRPMMQGGEKTEGMSGGCCCSILSNIRHDSCRVRTPVLPSRVVLSHVK